ncbi:MAG: DsbA family protein [Alphaproteobacteria bacterium]|nr:MAG: DsbA family protein [Alphaproteobacteria bacterium]
MRIAVLMGLAMLMLAGGARAAEPILTLGRPDAPVVVDEYFSLACSHCAEFSAQMMPRLRKEYIDTGKVRVNMYDLAFDKSGLLASALLRCVSSLRVEPMMTALYRAQKGWTHAPDTETALAKLAAFAGLDEAKARACMNDKTVTDALTRQSDEAVKGLRLQGTPSFIVNGTERLYGKRPYEDFATVFDRLLASGARAASVAPALAPSH